MATQHLGLEPKYIRFLPDQEKEVFQEFAQIGKGEGRVYKQKVGDHYSYFRAQGFFKIIWHFFFTKRLNLADLEGLYRGVTAKIDTSKDEEAVKRVSAAFFSVVCRVVNKNPMFGTKEVGILLTKQRDTVRACKRSTKPLSPIEISLLKHVAQVRECRDAMNSRCQRKENFRQEYDALFKRAKDMLSTMSPDDINKMGELSEKLRAKGSLTEDELALSVRAKELYYDVKNSIGERLDIEKLSQIKPELSLFQSLNIQSEGVDLILSQKKQAMKQKMDTLSLDELTKGYFDTDEEEKVKTLRKGALFRYDNKYIKVCVGNGWFEEELQERPSVRFYELQVTENGKLKLLNHTAYRLIEKPEHADSMRNFGRHLTTNQSFVSSPFAVTIESKIHAYYERVFATFDDK